MFSGEKNENESFAKNSKVFPNFVNNDLAFQNSNYTKMIPFLQKLYSV